MPPGVDLKGRAIYYVGPVDAVRDEAVGPAGPTTATRMDKFTDLLLEKTGLFVMIGKAERGPVAIEAIRRHKAAYLIAIGGAAYLVSKAIRKARVVAFEDLGMEAIYEFEVQGHAGDRRGRCARRVGARDGAEGVGRENQGAEDSGARRLAPTLLRSLFFNSQLDCLIVRIERLAGPAGDRGARIDLDSLRLMAATRSAQSVDCGTGSRTTSHPAG